jgi:hypothetical protein
MNYWVWDWILPCAYVKFSSTLIQIWTSLKFTRVEKREFAWEFSRLWYPGQRRTRVAMRVDESWLNITSQTSNISHQNLDQLKIVERAESRSRATLHQLSSSFYLMRFQVLGSSQTTMRVDESWQSRIVTGCISSSRLSSRSAFQLGLKVIHQ